ncbi:MAG TPA: hypothetical protein VMV44_13195 [Rectinemataceae bacterium]|nr:hypothetical protein [Rectinemataceae bacterium]
MRPPLLRGLVAAAGLCLAVSAAGFFDGCAGAPVTKGQSSPPANSTAATPQSPPPPGGTAATGTASGSSTSVGNTTSVTADGTAIQTPAAPAMTKAQAERKAIERALAFATPTSFAQAFDLIASSSLERSDARLLAWVGARMAAIVYPLSSTGFVPQDLRNQGAIPTGSLARMISEALSGRVAEVHAADTGDPLAELIPALSVFRSDSRETARLAFIALDRFASLGLTSVIPAIVRGLDAERRSQPDESLKAYREAIALAPDAWPAIQGAARDLLVLKRPAEALALLDAVPPDILANQDFRKIRAEALYENASFDEAAPLVARALADDPLDAHLMLIRADLLIRAQQWQQAIPLLDAFSTVDSSDRTLTLLRGLVAEGLRNRDEGLRLARKGLSSSPDDPEFLALAARLLLSPTAQPPSAEDRARDLQEARTDARRAFDLTAAKAPVPTGLSPARLAGRKAAGDDAARLLLEEAAGRYDWAAAVQYIDRARLAPSFASESLVALVLRKSGDWSRALDHATLWYRAKPDSEAAAEAYLRALIGSGNTKAAEDLLPRLLLGPGTTLGRSKLHYLQSLLAKSEEAALSSLRTSLVENSDNTEALLGVYDIYFRRQDWQRAAFYLKQALALAPRDPEIIQRVRELAAASPSAAIALPEAQAAPLPAAPSAASSPAPTSPASTPTPSLLPAITAGAPPATSP